MPPRAPLRRSAPRGTRHTAAGFIVRLKKMRSAPELRKLQRYFKSGEGEYGEGDIFIGVRMGHVFSLAKEFSDLAPDEIETLLESPIHEVRAGALRIMDAQGRNNRTPESRRKELYELYLRRTDRINNWDLVDVSAAFVVGRYLSDKPRTILTKLARSKSLWERRIAIVSTSYFIRQGDISDTFRIAEILRNDDEDLIHKAVGGWIRDAGKRDPEKLYSFLERRGRTLPRTLLRYAIEKLDKKKREYFMNM